MNNTKEFPLALHFLFTSQTKSIEFLVKADITKYGFNHRHSMTLDQFTLITIDPWFHPVSILAGFLISDNKGYLSTMT